VSSDKNPLRHTSRHPFACSLTTTLKSVHVLNYLKPAAGEVVLDVGCGLGYFLNLLAGRGKRGFGLDFSHKSLGLARQMTDCNLAQGDAQRLPYRADSFDKIIFTDVLEHVFDDRQTLREVARVARDGAKIALVTPGTRGALAQTSWRKLFHDEEGTPEFDERPGYLPDDLRQLMEANGIRVVQMRQTLIFVGEFLLQATKKYLKLKKLHYQTQGDIINITGSWSYKVYRRLLFPVFWSLARIEDMLLGRIANGHSLIALGVVDKSLLDESGAEADQQAADPPLAPAADRVEVSSELDGVPSR
jgi:SAM-dependent methyltransferase